MTESLVTKAERESRFWGGNSGDSFGEDSSVGIGRDRRAAVKSDGGKTWPFCGSEFAGKSSIIPTQHQS